MKTIIVYYSMEGNTEYAADKIAGLIGADTLRIYPKKAYPDKGFIKILWGGKSAIMSESPALEPYEFDASAYDRVIIGFPVWASCITPPIRTFIKENDLSGKSIAAFVCEAGNGGDKALEQLQETMGLEEFDAEMILIEPKKHPSDENEQMIQEFCEKLSCG